MKHAYYFSTIQEFLRLGYDGVLGKFQDDYQTETDYSYHKTIEHLQSVLNGIEGHIALEFKIPRIGRRADAILIINGVIFILEYKTGDTADIKSANRQCLNYTLDLKNFHEGSHNSTIIPISVFNSDINNSTEFKKYEDNIYYPIATSFDNLKNIIEDISGRVRDDSFDVEFWQNSKYKPTPTIIESAIHLYNNHNVEDISRSDSGENLTVTANRVYEIIKDSYKNNKKSIVFITGVPGAGKTLAGLNIASLCQDEFEGKSVFLSGNQPLVTVLKEALKRDNKKRKKIGSNPIDAFIQNIHHFRDEGLEGDTPNERIAIFDEAQRAWNKEQTTSFMKQKKGKKDFEMSEPEFLIEMMNRHNDWSVVVCLVGGGQEINKGEAGVEEWFNALSNRFTDWNVYLSNELINHREYSMTELFDIQEKIKNMNAKADSSLHLSVSMRSFRAENQANFIHAILDKDIEESKNNFVKLKDYEIKIARDKSKMIDWLKSKKRGGERTGIIAHSNALRLFPEGIYVKNKIDHANWFLSDDNDVRSSDYLEISATEFDIQGLEIDWAGVCWDINLCPTDNGWDYKQFRGTKWGNINNDINKKYLLNAYRVLLTRARQGMVIYIPRGDESDPTRPPEKYNKIYNYLISCGIKDI